MLIKEVEKALNEQITIEAESSQIYLAMASWAEVKGLEGVAEFMYAQSDEERQHMLKLVKYINIALLNVRRKGADPSNMTDRLNMAVKYDGWHI